MKKQDFLSTTELAKILGISRIAVFKKIKSGDIKAMKIGRNFVIYKKDLKSIFDKELKEKNRKNIERAVKKTIEEYGETLKLLGKT